MSTQIVIAVTNRRITPTALMLFVLSNDEENMKTIENASTVILMHDRNHGFLKVLLFNCKNGSL